MSVVVLRAGERLAGVDPSDRGLAYGDGVFETVLVHEGQPVWWDAHWARLELGATRLGFLPPDAADVRGHAQALLSDAPPRCVLKLIVTRGTGGRGYAVPAAVAPTVILSVSDAPAPSDALTLRWCETRWARQPRLAGIKHLNRLEQVLARAEWTDPGIFDGLVLDTAGEVASATAANLFIRRDGQWLTPPVDACGIAGLLRAWLLAHAPDAGVAALTPADVLAAEEIFLCNAVRGILPVRRLEAREWTAWAATTELRKRLAGAEPAFMIRES